MCMSLTATATLLTAKYVDGKFVLDERTVDGHYYASVFKIINRIIQDPSILEVPPTKVNEDIF